MSVRRDTRCICAVTYRRHGSGPFEIASTIGAARDYRIEANVAEQLPTVPKGQPGDRVLSKEELRTLWTVLNDNFPAHRVLKLMIAMGGMRVTEITVSHSDYWGDGWLHLPETKNGRSHSLPITRHAESIVETCQEYSDPRSAYLFSHPRKPDKPMTTAAVSRASKRLNKALAFPGWNPRDIR